MATAKRFSGNKVCDVHVSPLPAGALAEYLPSGALPANGPFSVNLFNIHGNGYTAAGLEV